MISNVWLCGEWFSRVQLKLCAAPWPICFALSFSGHTYFKTRHQQPHWQSFGSLCDHYITGRVLDLYVTIT